jgi:hypothetical protein
MGEESVCMKIEKIDDFPRNKTVCAATGGGCEGEKS